VYADSISGVEIEQKIELEGNTNKDENKNPKPWKASTRNHYRAFLMLCYREGRRNGKTRTNPARHARHWHENNCRVRFLTPAEEAKLVAAIQADYPEHMAEFIFARNTGLRLGSQYTATYEMLDLARKVLDIPRTKNGEPVHIPLNDTVLTAIRSPPSYEHRTGPIFRNLRYPHKPVLSNDHWFKKALAKAGIANFKWHDLRHCYASDLIQRGVPLERVAKLLGHKSLAMALRYAHLSPSQLAADVALLDVKRVEIGTELAPDTLDEKLTAYMVN